MKKTIFLFLLLPVCSWLAGSAAAQDAQSINITSTAVPFLRISPDARSGGMGDAAIGLSADANSIYHNLAKTPFADARTGIAANYNPWLREAADDMYLMTLGGFYQFRGGQAFSASLRYFNLGTTPLIDYSGNRLSTRHPAEYTAELGYSRKLSDRFGVGIAARFIHSSLGTTGNTSYRAGSAVAADLSFFYNGLTDAKKGWAAGLSLSNLGSRMSYAGEGGQKDFLPANLGLGVAYTESPNEENKVSIAVDINKLLVPEVPADAAGMKAYRETALVKSWLQALDAKDWQLSIGGEYSYRELVSLRAGYMRKTYAGGQWQHITAGIGLQLSSTTLNLSYLVPVSDKTARSPLSNTIRAGLLFHMGSK